MWADRVSEIRDLHPRVIRLFIQEYFDLLPEHGHYHWQTLDESVDLIRKTGATPLMNIDFKPKVLYPTVDEKIVDPTSYEEWDQLIYNMVRHYKERGSGIRYWEVSNEPDIGENGGCPYLFTPENYTRYYQHTVGAVWEGRLWRAQAQRSCRRCSRSARTAKLRCILSRGTSTTAIPRAFGEPSIA